MMLSHAAVANGHTIREFYESPELGAHCVAVAMERYDLLPVTHWYYSLPWLAELGMEVQYMDWMPPVPKAPIVLDPSQVEELQVPGREELLRGATLDQLFRSNDYVQRHLPKMFSPLAIATDLTGSGAQLVGVENFIMWTLTEPDLAHALVRIYMETAAEGAGLIAERYGEAVITTGSVLGNNDIFSDAMVRDFSGRYLNEFVMKCFEKGAGPQVFYHLCGNHETDYKLFRDGLMWSPFTVFHIGYKGRNPFPSSLLKQNFQDRATCMGSVDTKLMIDPNPNKVYNQAKEQLLGGRDSKKGYILGTSCETPPYTIPGQMLALVKAARDFGTYGTW
jgi:uroporphyrinogen decarboxylase